jgi:hypothetical protein
MGNVMSSTLIKNGGASYSDKKHDHVGNVMSSTLTKNGGASCSDKKRHHAGCMLRDNGLQHPV